MSYPAEVAGHKNCEEVRAYSIPLVTSSEKQLNAVIKQAVKNLMLTWRTHNFSRKLKLGARNILCQLTIIQHR